MPVAIIFGGAGRTGSTVAARLIEDGWSVVLADIDQAAGQAHAQAIGSMASFVRIDVTDRVGARQVINDVAALWGTVDGVVYAVGGRQGADVGEFMETDSQSWRATVDLHFRGLLNVYHAVLPIMQQQGRGALCALSAVEATRGLPESAVFSAAKAGVAMLNAALVRECKPFGVRVNTIIPPNAESLQDSGANDASRAIAEAIAFLLSSKAAMTTGASIDVSNGWALH
jgi:NAD(P)-dependent dehydrogenase (short-subunit alcohol dehydrogenase family)